MLLCVYEVEQHCLRHRVLQLELLGLPSGLERDSLRVQVVPLVGGSIDVNLNDIRISFREIVGTLHSDAIQVKHGALRVDKDPAGTPLSDTPLVPVFRTFSQQVFWALPTCTPPIVNRFLASDHTICFVQGDGPKLILWLAHERRNLRQILHQDTARLGNMLNFVT